MELAVVASGSNAFFSPRPLQNSMACSWNQQLINRTTDCSSITCSKSAPPVSALFHSLPTQTSRKQQHVKSGGLCPSLLTCRESSLLSDSELPSSSSSCSSRCGFARSCASQNPQQQNRTRSSLSRRKSPQSSRLRCLSSSSPSAASTSSEEVIVPEDTKRETEEHQGDGSRNRDVEGDNKGQRPNTFQSSWDAKDSEGNDYLYRLGQESDNLNISVGAKVGMIDHIFVGDFLGKEADIVFAYRQKVTRSFQHLQGDYYIAPAFLDTVVTHITKNFLASTLDTQVPLILGIWGGKGQGKSFQLELICKALGMEPIIMSAGELESEWAGEPGKLIRDRYRTASQVIHNQGKMSALVINDLDAGIGRFANTQCTVNNQMVVGTLMNLADNPTRVSVGQEWRESDVVNRVPIIATGNDFSTLWAPLIRDGRMDKFYWQPTREDIMNIVHQMYRKDGLSMEDIGTIVDTFPNQALDFYGALRSRTYDKAVLKWIEEIGGAEKLGAKLVSRKKTDEPLPVFVAPEVNIEKLIEAGNSLAEEQRLVNEMRLSDSYMKKQTGGGGLNILAT